MNNRKINILGVIYTVKIKKLENKWGEIDFTEKKIFIDPSDEHNHEQTLLHEIMHGILHVSGHSFNIESHEEGIIRVLDHGIFLAGYRLQE